MLTFTGKGKAVTCDGVTRRDFLQVGALGAVGLSLPNYLAAQAAGSVKSGHDNRSCIMIFNLGAPSQLDTFDMKPEAPAEIRGVRFAGNNRTLEAGLGEFSTFNLGVMSLGFSS